MHAGLACEDSGGKCLTWVALAFSPREATGLVALELVSEGLETTFFLAKAGLLGI